ncbi:hypothetical protein IWZ01DRAFT_479504 [Phyllosticta capitalensis]
MFDFPFKRVSAPILPMTNTYCRIPSFDEFKHDLPLYHHPAGAEMSDGIAASNREAHNDKCVIARWAVTLANLAVFATLTFLYVSNTKPAWAGYLTWSINIYLIIILFIKDTFPNDSHVLLKAAVNWSIRLVLFMNGAAAVC